MSKNLVIVESPAKAKTIKKYLGPDFEVLASYGHVRDLVPKEGAVDPDDGFAMRYEVTDRSEKHITAIARALKKADALYLATDPDREGEAISWHLYELLKDRGKLNGKPVHRVVFHEITKNAIRDAVANPRTLSEDLINAQQARRALDYLVGFNLSPLLWKKVRPGLSAGRVQSPALRMICEREDEIEKFKAQEYWTIEADALKDGQPVASKLVEFQGKKLDQFDIDSEARAQEVESALTAASAGALVVSAVDKKKRNRYPAAPFTTSTLQQEASRKLGFTAQRTMRTAQQLYESGLITYMRTDSVTLGNDAIAEIRSTIVERFGAKNLPASPRTYKTKAKNAQEAHEAIRPTTAANAPEQVRGGLGADQARLYELIWKRAVACQMTHAVFDTVAVDLAAGDGNRFRANGSTLVEPGFIAVYLEDVDDKTEDDDERTLPPLEAGDRLDLVAIKPEQHFTQPPPRYSEASLVKTLEEYGIGRPSTYASIISTLLQREYVGLDKRRFTPTDVGRIVNRFLTQHFGKYVDYDFTAKLEDDLDAIARGESDWIPLLDGFWSDFKGLVDHKEESVSRDEVQQARELGSDPKTGKPVTVRMGRFGPFVQIGTRDDEEKPKFAGLRPGQKIDSISFEEAMKLFRLPRELGETPEGEPLSVNIGRFGPFVKYGKKYASIREDDPYEITRERALEIVAEKRIADANRLINEWPDAGVEVLNGRYGPYITDKERNARVPKDTDPRSLTLEQCRELLAKAPKRRGRFKKKKATKKKKASASRSGADRDQDRGRSQRSASKKKAKKKSKAKPKAPAQD